MELSGIFSGITVLELASVLAGPAVGQFFAELGADVVKIENHKAGGDVTRSWKVQGEGSSDVSSYFSSVNWGKRSMGIDLSEPSGQELVFQMVGKADFVIASFKPGGARRLRMDYDTLRSINPAIVYGSITGYGQEDPRVGYDAIIQAEAGFMSMNAEPDGHPMKMPVALMDILAAHHLKEALLLAYIRRQKTGEGAEVSVSLFDAAVASLANQGANYLVTGHPPRATGSLHPNIAPYGESFDCADGKSILLAIGNDSQFARLCSILGIPKIAAEPMFLTNQDRLQNRTLLSAYLSEAMRQADSAGFLEECRKQGVPAGAIRTVDEALSDPQVQFLTDGDLRGIPTFTANRNKPDLSAPPHLGEHTNAVLGDFLTPEEISRLKQYNIIG